MFRGTLWAESCLPTRYPKRVQSTQSFVPRRQSSEMTSLAVDFLCVISFGLSLSSSTPLYCHCSVQRVRKKSFRNPHGTPKLPLKIISAVKTPRNGDMPWWAPTHPQSHISPKPRDPRSQSLDTSVPRRQKTHCVFSRKEELPFEGSSHSDTKNCKSSQISPRQKPHEEKLIADINGTFRQPDVRKNVH